VSPVARWALVIVGAIAVAVLLVTGGQRILERQRTTQEVNRLREELYRARVGADRCRSSLASSETSLRALSATIDSLRERVDGYETGEGDARGVPAAQYGDYLETFESYNDSVASWEARERRLRSAEASCREAIEAHNALSDSLQQLLRDAGIVTGDG
jgi:chromosome segregation ATPase